MGHSPRGHKESDTTEHSTFLKKQSSDVWVVALFFFLIIDDILGLR